MGGTEWSDDQTLCIAPHAPNDIGCDWRCKDGWTRGTNYGAGNATACWLPKGPTINVVGAGTMHVNATHDEAQHYNDQGAGCTDDALHCDTTEECNLDQRVVVFGDVVDMTVVGTYFIQYECTSPIRLLDAPSMYRVVIVDDFTCPECTFADVADANITIEASFPYLPNDELPSCTDNCGFSADAKCNVETAPGALVSSDVDVEKIGTYYVTYTAVALRAENQCQSSNLVRTVHVIDTLKPVIGFTTAGSATVLTVGDGGSSSVSHIPPCSQPSRRSLHVTGGFCERLGSCRRRYHGCWCRFGRIVRCHQDRSPGLALNLECRSC
jgi:hypothetical protein